MTRPDFDTEALFDEDYLYFYGRQLDDERDTAETELITELVRLPSGAAVLDLGCGHGRISNRLAERGYRMTGVDITQLFLDRARRDAAERGVSVEYVHGDMRELPWTERFDAVVNWFTTFGYFDDADNRRVLHEVAGALKPGGVFLLDLNHYLHLLRHREQQSTVAERDGDFLIDRHNLDPLANRNEVERIVVRDGTVRRLRYFVRMFTFTEIRDWLLDAGFTCVDGYGEDGHPLTMDSRRMLVLARRSGGGENPANT